jgi:hypothetical protein
MTDDKEIELARSLLTAAVAPRMDTIVNEGGFNREIRRKWNAFGGGKQTARDLVNSLYGAYLRRQSHLFNARTLFVFVLDTCRRHSFRTGAWRSYPMGELRGSGWVLPRVRYWGGHGHAQARGQRTILGLADA